MMVRAWRLTKEKFAADAFSGEGAFKFGGRWNSAGVRVVYAAQSIALATLEILVGGATVELLDDFVKIPVEFEASCVHTLRRLPERWNVYPPCAETRNAGDAWVKDKKSAVLKVPSAVIPEEFIYLLNPMHSDFACKCNVGKPEKFRVDKRLLPG